MKRIVTALVAAATLAGAAMASSAPAEARWGWGWGLGGLCRRRRHRQRAGLVVLLSVRLLRLLRAVSLSTAALRVAQCMERLRLGSCLRLTDRSRVSQAGGQQLRRFPIGYASQLRMVVIFDT